MGVGRIVRGSFDDASLRKVIEEGTKQSSSQSGRAKSLSQQESIQKVSDDYDKSTSSKDKEKLAKNLMKINEQGHHSRQTVR